MFRVLVIANTEAVSKEIASWAVSGENLGNKYGKRYEVSGRSAFLRVFPLWTNLKGAPAIGDVLLFVAKTPEDLAGMESFANSYKRIPVKFILCDGVEPQPDFESKWAAKSLKKGAPTELVEMIITANNDLVKSIATAFKKFDTNNDGSIDLKEIQAMAKELGLEMTESEATKLIKIMDVNKDGKISLEEFIAWWKSGCQGSSQKINSVMKLVFKKNPEIQKVLESFKMLTDPAQTDKAISILLGIHLGSVAIPGLSLDVGFISNGKELDAEFEEFAEAIKVTKEDNFAAVSFGVKNAKEAFPTLKDVVSSAVLMGTSLSAKAAEIFSNLELKYGLTADKAIVCAVPSMKGATNIAPFMDSIEAISKAMLPNQSLMFKSSFATDFEKITVEDKTIIDHIFNGLTFDVIGKLHPQIKDRIIEILQNSGTLTHIPPQMQGVIPVMTASSILNLIKFEMAFDPTEDLKESIITSPGNDYLKTSFKEARNEMIPAVKEMMASIPILEMVNVFLKDQVESIKIFIYVSGIGAIKVFGKFTGLGKFLTY